MIGLATLILALTFATLVTGGIVPQPYIDIDKDVQIYLYTLKNPTEPQLLFVNDTKSISESNYNRKIPTRIFIHGYYSKGELKESLTESYFIKSKRNVNLIAINWEKASVTFNYVSARNNVEQLGNLTANFIDFMVENKMLKLSDLTVIGFSLGAHIAGIAGKRLRSGKLPKIIGLDPTSVLFSIEKPHERLDSTDAVYVETIHTSRLGFYDPLGTVSFYPNGGRSQPECWSWNLLCAHQTAYKYFAQSISSETPFVGQLCNSKDELKDGICTGSGKSTLGGEPGAKKQPPGIYYIEISLDPEDSPPTFSVFAELKFRHILLNYAN